MTQDEYNLFTGESINIDGEDWAVLLEVAEARLASFLCLEKFPANPSNLMKELLANFMCAVFHFRGNGTDKVEEKRVRNFTVRFANDTAPNAFAQVARNYGDLVEELSECGSGLKVERGVCHWEDWGRI
jgi:hypothetical protein